ncbi:HNH endonuclease [Hymenobacter weizhouensis]|uniref:HNH endonuclease n=1 Tax=Hymenobacter sp. YIM 151500-1 TaxID=2987689 RepID=UPI0039B6EC4C
MGGRYRAFGRRATWESILQENSAYTSSNRLKNRLLRAGYKQAVCEQCGLAQWLNRPIPLELHHVNGISNDHRLENLQLLCPNCHALTPSYRGRNQARARVV